MRKYTFIENGGDTAAQHEVIISPAATYFRLVSVPTQAAPIGYPVGYVFVDGGAAQSISRNEGQSQIAPFRRFSFLGQVPGTYVFAIGIGEEIQTENVVVTQAVSPPPPISFTSGDGIVPAGGYLQVPLILSFGAAEQVSVDLCTLVSGLVIVPASPYTQGLPLPASVIYHVRSGNVPGVQLTLYNPTAAAITIGWLMLSIAV